MFTFLVFTKKYPFWANLVPKFKIAHLNWNLVPNLNPVCRIQWCISFFSVLNWIYVFWVNLVQKIKIVSLNWNLVRRLIRIYRIHWRCSLYLFQTGNTLFVKLWSKKSHLSVTYPEIFGQTGTNIECTKVPPWLVPSR